MGFWGKLSEDRSQQLLLADHCIDVASVFRALCDLPAIRRSLGLGENAVQMDRLAVFALLIAFNQRPCFGPIRQADLFQALLRLWLDEDPRRSVLQLERAADTASTAPSRFSAWKALP